MQHVARPFLRRKVKQAVGWGASDRVRNYELYPHRLQFYEMPPNEEVSLEEFETLAIERLKVLKAIETAKVRWPKRGNDFDTFVRTAIKQHLPFTIRADEDTAFDERRRDHISHFVLRLAYCKSEDLRRWFLLHEAELFRFRFEQERIEEANLFLKTNDLKYKPVSIEKKQVLAPKLARVGFNLTEESVKGAEYFEVPFEDALELVRSRRVFIEQGRAYVARREMLPIVVGVFRARLSSALVATSKALGSLEEDERVLPMLNTLSKQYLGKTYGQGSGSKVSADVSAGDVAQLSSESFPLCMRTAQDHLTGVHHMRHGGRMQYGLFLKGIGMSLTEALTFWRVEFGKAMSMDKFEKQHAYNIRHNYGKEGKRTDYTPYSCMKIIMGSAPNRGDSHGCPFRHYDEDALKMKLLKYKVAPAGIHEITGLVRDHHYQVACGRYFELTHKLERSVISINHPNQYYEESRKLITGEDPSSAAANGADKYRQAINGRTAGGMVTAAPMDTAAETEPVSDSELLAAMEQGEM